MSTIECLCRFQKSISAIGGGGGKIMSTIHHVLYIRNNMKNKNSINKIRII